jgi:hypothetical protein
LRICKTGTAFVPVFHFTVTGRLAYPFQFRPVAGTGFDFRMKLKGIGSAAAVRPALKDRATRKQAS